MILILFFSIVLIPILGKLFKISFKAIKTLLVNAVCGTILLFVVNIILKFIDMEIPLNLLTVMLVGFFGIPAVIILGIYYIWLI